MPVPVPPTVPDPLDALPVDPHGLVVRAAALGPGASHAERRRLVAAGRLVVLRPGVYASAAAWAGADERRQHLLRARAALARIPDGVLSHASAGLAYGWPQLGPLPAKVHLTGPARTVVDVAGTSTGPGGLVVADAALRTSDLSREALLRELDRASLRHRPSARRVLVLADGRSESPGEWLSRCAIWQAGPPPELQHELFDEAGFVGRVDFWWGNASVVGEFDGRLKYSDPRVLWEEKLREDRLRALGLRIVRWGWAEAYRDFGPVAARLRAMVGTRDQQWSAA